MHIHHTIESFLSTYPQWVIIIQWATATGKTSLAVSLSDFFDIEIINADSRQIYQSMDIGTDKVSQEIRSRIPHHLIDIVTPDMFYTSSQRQRDCYTAIDTIQHKKRVPLIVWGTGLYIDTIYRNFTIPEVVPDYTYRQYLSDIELKSPWTIHTMLTDIDPIEAQRLHPRADRHIIRALEIHHVTGKPKSSLVRSSTPRYPLLMIVLQRPPSETNQRIDERVHDMLNSWLIEEVRHLLSLWYTATSPGMKCIGYSETIQYLDGQISRDKLIDLICIHSHQYAKRQRTWFRRYERDSRSITPNTSVIYEFVSL